jgi:hypothetical protein
VDAYRATVNDVAASINDALNTRGGEVTSLGYSLINRARMRIWKYKVFPYLVKSASLTVDANGDASLPADFGRVVKILSASTGWQPEYLNSDPSADYRYEIVTTVATTVAGITKKMHFSSVASATVYLWYLVYLDPVSTVAHYLLFSAELIIKAALLIHAEDRRHNPRDVQMASDAFDAAIRDEIQFYFDNDVSFKPYPKDYEGAEVVNDDISMVGD